MRPFLLATSLACAPLALLADDISLTSKVTAVTLYPEGGTITRTVPFSAPVGAHQLIVTDLSSDTQMENIRVLVNGAQMGAITARQDFVPPRTGDEDAEIKAAEDAVDSAEAALRAARGRVETIRLQAEAARARADFLKALGDNDSVAELGPDSLRDLVALVGEETLSALQDAHEAELRAVEAERDLKEFEVAVEDAKKALAALVPQDEDRAYLAIAITAEEATEGEVEITYTTWNAGWLPVYDLKLDRSDEVLTLERGAFVLQGTGENWTDVALTLSTVRPTEKIAPGEVWPRLRRIYDPEQEMVQSRAAEASLGMFTGGAVADAAMAEPMVVEAAASFDGLAVTYQYPENVSIASGADRIRLALGTLETDVEITARAVPLNEDVAYLNAELTNDMDELILPTSVANFYLDGRFMGQNSLEMIPAGADADVAFGPIDGLRLKRTVLNRNEGDRGMISRSTEQVEEVRIEIENLTGEGWDVELIDRVPYSEQEDLEISWAADPMPDEQDIDGKRGVMSWELYVGAGETATVSLSHQLEWPEGQALR